MTEGDIVNLIRDQFEQLMNERGLIIPISSLANLPGAKNNAGAAFLIPNSTAPFSIAVSDGEGNWNEFQNVGPVS